MKGPSDIVRRYGEPAAFSIAYLQAQGFAIVPPGAFPRAAVTKMISWEQLHGGGNEDHRI